MYGLLKFIIKYHFTILFLFLEFLAISFAVNFNKHQNTVFLTSAGAISSYFNEKTSNIKQYFGLKEKNSLLAKQNAELLNRLKKNRLNNSFSMNFVEDSLRNFKYFYTDAKIIKNSVYLKHNYISINKGSKNGVSVGDGIISPEGVVGVVTKTSEHFSNVISILNTDLFISAKIKRDNYFGSINWDGNNYRFVKLKEIPFHVQLEKGDTIVTSGYSQIFPPDIPIGIISDFTKLKDGDFYDIKVKLLEDFKKLDNVYIVSNLRRNELKEIEESDD